MAQVTVNTYANLRQYTDGRPSVQVEIPVGITIRKLLEELQIPAQETKIVFADHRSVSLDQALRGGEQLDLFSAIGGG